jgi:RimJ/RimL family protein N-acetyltransferase
MKTWIKHPTVLSGQIVELVPLEIAHLEELYTLASDQRIWQFIPADCSKRERFDEAYAFALSERETGTHYPFVVLYRATGKLIGSTRLFDMVEKDRKLEIGWTWITAEHWGTAVNLECKLLLLTYCFEVLQARRVQIKTDENNIRSRKAIAKIGGQFEGILRKDKIRDNGTSRNTAYFSIIDTEWPAAKEKLTRLLEDKLQ